MNVKVCCLQVLADKRFSRVTHYEKDFKKNLPMIMMSFKRFCYLFGSVVYESLSLFVNLIYYHSSS